MTPLSGLPSTGSGVGLRGFTSWLPQLQAVTLDLSEPHFLHLQNGGVKIISAYQSSLPVIGFCEASRTLGTGSGTYTSMKTVIVVANKPHLG